MEILLPHRVEYLVEGYVPIEDVIESLQAQQKIVSTLGELLDEVLDGITVQKAELRVRSIDTGSLKEAFFVALFLVYQAELKSEVPAMIEKWLGLPVDDRYDTLVTVGIMLLVFYGADYAYKRYTDQLGSERLKRQLEDFVSELSHVSGKSEAEVRKIVERFLGKSGRLREMAKAAIKFFRPSRNKRNEPIRVGDKQIETDVVSEVPNQVNLSELDTNDHSVPIYDTRIELRAKDHDNEGSGWGGIVHTISSKRKPVRLYPHVPKDFLWKNDTVWADVLVTYRTQDNGKQEPVRYHIMAVHEDRPHTPLIPPSDAPSDTQ